LMRNSPEKKTGNPQGEVQRGEKRIRGRGYTITKNGLKKRGKAGKKGGPGGKACRGREEKFPEKKMVPRRSLGKEKDRKPSKGGDEKKKKRGKGVRVGQPRMKKKECSAREGCREKGRESVGHHQQTKTGKGEQKRTLTISRGGKKKKMPKEVMNLKSLFQRGGKQRSKKKIKQGMGGGGNWAAKRRLILRQDPKRRKKKKIACERRRPRNPTKKVDEQVSERHCEGKKQGATKLGKALGNSQGRTCRRSRN